jgi:protein TonB
MKHEKVIVEPAASGMITYGRSELKAAYRKNYLKGLIIATSIFALTFASYYAVQYFGEDDDNIPMVSVRVVKYSDLGPPPSITATTPPPSVNVAASVKPTVGIPVPVPDAEVSAEVTLATQSELSAQPTPALEQGLGEGGNVQIQQDIVIEDEEPGMDAFIPVEKQPQIVKRVVPEYPPMAVRAGLEGTVWVKILVDKDGRPKKAVVVKSTAEMFDDAAVQAAMQFVFTPAVMNNGPVKVWVSIPFRFTLKDAGPS